MNNIEHYRRRAGLTQEELAKKIGATQPMIANWETGHNKPSVDNAIRLSEVFKCKVGELFGKK